jgi:hypothetical protein
VTLLEASAVVSARRCRVGGLGSGLGPYCIVRMGPERASLRADASGLLCAGADLRPVPEVGPTPIRDRASECSAFDCINRVTKIHPTR